MKATDHVEYLLRQGKKPKELLALGFSKSVVTRVSRQLKEEKTALQPKTSKDRAEAKSRPQASAGASMEMAPIQQKLESLESQIQGLETRVEGLEALGTDLEDIQDRLNATPTVGLRHRFKCHCGAAGFVALHIQCTKCGRESYWGWFPKE